MNINLSFFGRRVMIEAKTAGLEKGWFDTFKEKFNLDGLTEKVKTSKDKIIEVGIYLGLGFLVGFLLRRFSKFLIVLLLFIAAIILLDQFDIIKVAVNWNKVQEVFGIRVVQTVDGSLLSTYWAWVKTNFLVVFSFLIGFAIGLKVG